MKMSQFERVDVRRSPKLTAVVADMLRKKILSGNLREGDNLPPEQELLAQLGVSRPTLREALRVLESENLIVPRRGSRSGAAVSAPSVASSARYMGFLLQYQGVTVADVLQARTVVEPPLAGLMARRENASALRVLRDSLLREEEALEDNLRFGQASIQFHELVAELSGVRTLALTVRQYNWVLRRLMDEAELHGTAFGAPGAANAKAHRSHVRFVDLVEAGIPDDVESYWRSHVEEIGRRLISSWGEHARVSDLFS
jgi:DNA-binding FadR family transcriptional regulator